jgi:hypothetical protein
MDFYAKLSVFWIALFGALWILARFPESRITRAAYSWQGPFPARGERYSHFMRRRSAHVFFWFVQSVVAFLALWIAIDWKPALAENALFMATWFGLTLLAGTFLLSAAVLFTASLKHSLFGPDPTCVLDAPQDEI